MTLWYRAPELLLQLPYGPACDVWSLACIVAELYTVDALLPGAHSALALCNAVSGRNELQQLRLVFRLIGLPAEHEWPSEAIVTRANFISAPANDGVA